MRWNREKKGYILVFVLVILIALSGIALAFLYTVNYQIKSTGVALQDAQAFYIAEAGLAKARRALTTGGEIVGWQEEDVPFGAGTYTVTTTDNGDDTYTMVSDGYVPDDTTPAAQRRVKEKNIPATFVNLSLGATASASSEQGSQTADKANDGASGTRWTSSGGNGSWIAMDFGSATAFDKVIFDEFGDKINTYEIQYSADAVGWTAVSNPSESVNGSVTTVTFDSVSRRYVRLFISDTGNKPSIKEFESYDIAGGGETLGQGTFVTLW